MSGTAEILAIIMMRMMTYCTFASIIQPGFHLAGEAHNMCVEDPKYRTSTANDIVYSMGECWGCGNCTIVIRSTINITYEFTPRSDTNGMRYVGKIYTTGLFPLYLGQAEATKPDSSKAGEPFVYTNGVKLFLCKPELSVTMDRCNVDVHEIWQDNIPQRSTLVHNLGCYMKADCTTGVATKQNK